MISNKQILDTIISEGNQNFKMSMKGIDTSNHKEVYEFFQANQGLQNEFISALVNKIVKTQFFSKIYENPLKLFHRGMIPYGDTIENIFVERSKRVGFDKHFNENGGTSENDLLGKLVPRVIAQYKKKNFAHKYKVSISDSMLKTAFTNENGLSKMCMDLVNANLNGAYIDEFNDMKRILTQKTDASDNVNDGTALGKGVIQRALELSTWENLVINTTGLTTKDIAKKISVRSELMCFPSNKYNITGVENFASKDELVLITTPEFSTDLDMDILAYAFNMDKADIPFRIVKIDSFPSFTTKTSKSFQPKAIICDKDLIQAWDIVNTSRIFENGDGLYINHFLHKQGIMTSCDFSQLTILGDVQA